MANKEAVLERIESDLQVAQAEIETVRTVEDSPIDSLKFGFGSLYAAVHNLIAGFGDHTGKINDLNRQLKDAVLRITDLEKRIHGLKVAKGKAIASKNKALAAVASAKGALDTISLH